MLLGHHTILHDPQQERIRDCKFYIAFENCNCSSFVTEKYLNALEAGAIPIVSGYRDFYESTLPGASIIVSNYPSLLHMVNHMEHLLKNETAFLEFHKWRTSYRVERMEYQPLCELCRKLEEFTRKTDRKPSIIENLSKTRLEIQNCTPIV